MSAIRIDGSRGEGGGQILRTSLALSMLTGRPCEVFNVRANRKPGGLRPQHLECVRAACLISNGAAAGDRIGSRTVRFQPGEVRPAEFDVRIPTAGSAALVLHTIFLPLLFARDASVVRITGGTHVPFAPTADYLAACWSPALSRLGHAIAIRLLRSGFYPAGGGLIEARIAPTASPPTGLTWTDRGELLEIEIVSVAAKLAQSIAQRLADEARRLIEAAGIPESFVRQVHFPEREAASPGAMLGLRCRYENADCWFDSLGARGKPAETVAGEAVAAFLDFHQGRAAAVDPHLADQLLLPLAAGGQKAAFSTSRVTQHLLTNAEVIAQFLSPTIEIEGEPGEPALVRIAR